MLVSQRTFYQSVKYMYFNFFLFIYSLTTDNDCNHPTKVELSNGSYIVCSQRRHLGWKQGGFSHLMVQKSKRFAPLETMTTCSYVREERKRRRRRRICSNSINVNMGFQLNVISIYIYILITFVIYILITFVIILNLNLAYPYS